MTGSGVEDGNATGGFVGKYHGVVVGNEDPTQRNRLEVTVAEVSASSAWAEPSENVRYSDPPEIGAEVWIEYENGDAGFPCWVGLR